MPGPVWASTLDGERKIALEVHFDRFENEIAYWKVTQAVDVKEYPRMHIDVLPPKTAVEWPAYASHSDG